MNRTVSSTSPCSSSPATKPTCETTWAQPSCTSTPHRRAPKQQACTGCPRGWFNSRSKSTTRRNRSVALRCRCTIPTRNQYNNSNKCLCRPPVPHRHRRTIPFSPLLRPRRYTAARRRPRTRLSFLRPRNDSFWIFFSRFQVLLYCEYHGSVGLLSFI